MAWWVNAIGAGVGSLATFVIAWSALKPKQRIFATRLVMRWMERGFMALGLTYFVWMNWSFLAKEGPVGRTELWLLMLVNAEAVLVLCVLLFVRIFSWYSKKESERYINLLKRVEAPVSTKSSTDAPAGDS